MKKRKSSFDIGEGGFHYFSIIVLAVLTAVTLAPVILVFTSSFSDETTLLRNGYSFIPQKWSLEAYISILNRWNSIFSAYRITVIVTAAGTLMNVLMTLLFAYPLSRKDFKYRNFFSFVVFFTMLFNGGVVPQYILYARYLNVKNTLWGLIMPNRLMSAFNVFLVRNYFTNNIPSSLVESAKIDGASELQVFIKIMVPLAKPVIATIALFVGLAYWNDWVNGLYYTSKANLYSLQLLLKKLLDNIQFLTSGQATGIMAAQATLPSNSYRMALAVIGLLPVLTIYPFVQKYLIQGTVIGAVKG